jgi:hypothetical protein
VISQTQNRFEPGESPPTIATRETPKSLGHTGIQSLKVGSAFVPKPLSLEVHGHRYWIVIENHWREGTAPTVVGFDQVQH